MPRDRTTSAAPVSRVFRGYRPAVCSKRCHSHPHCICTQREAAKALEERVAELEAMTERLDEALEAFKDAYLDHNERIIELEVHAEREAVAIVDAYRGMKTHIAKLEARVRALEADGLEGRGA